MFTYVGNSICGNVHSTSVSSPKRALRREAPCQGIPLVCKSWHTPWRMNPSSVLSDHALTAGDVRGASVRTIASPAPGSRRRAGTQGSGLHTAQCVRLGTRCATIADGSPGRHRRRTSEASSAATEHAATLEVMTPSTDDDNTGQLARSALKPLEAQGRGFTHGHEKIISMPRTRVGLGRNRLE